MDDPFEPIAQRFGFPCPDLYRRMRADGCFDRFGESHLQFSDLEWMGLDEIVSYTFNDDQIPGLVPVAGTMEMDLWCWYPAMNDGGPAPIVFCPLEDEVASIYAPDFTAWIYRLMLEEYACTGLTEHLDVRQSRVVLDHYTERMAAYLPPAWHARLLDLRSRDFSLDANGYYGVADADELEAILTEDLAYPRLDEEFEHFVGN
ncbi:MAG: hypothetical protein PF961_09845 [Planctomycetota bacterium]|jgi:hypothetical protein|nr:hypothetical protein [Planctomycetota bacterium]